MGMRLALSCLAALIVSGMFASGFAYLATLPERVMKTTFAPGSRVVVPLGSFTIEGTVEGPAAPANILRKGDRLDRKPATPRWNGPYCSPLQCRVI